MKKIILSFLLGGSIFTIGCESNNNAAVTTAQTPETATQPDTATKMQESGSTPPPAPQSREARATEELCQCMNKHLADMSPQVREIIINAGKSGNPMQELTSALQKAATSDDQQRLIWELERFGDGAQLQKCAEAIKAKYNLDERDKEQQQIILQEAAKNGNCELVYALMKIGVHQANNANNMRQ